MKMSFIEFSVENFKIFREKTTFSMFARKSSHTFGSNGENLLKTSLIYGPNASGKSTLLQAFVALWNGIIKSANNPEGSILPYQPFALSSEEDKPVFFEVVFSLGKNIFKYNFSFSKSEIRTENLFEILSSGKEKKYIVRKKQNIKLFAEFKKSKDIKIKTRKEVLFLSAASQWNNDLAMKIVEGFKNDIRVIDSTNTEHYGGHTVGLLKKERNKKDKVLDFLKRADFCIENIIVEKIAIPEIPESIKQQILAMGAKNIPNEADTVFFSHNKFNTKGVKIGIAKFNSGEESKGTQKFFDVIGPIVDTLENGKVLIIDEFDNSLHPYLTKFIIDLFEENNPKNAQLIVTTHDTSLLSHKELNKEQFWFTEKDKFGAGKLFSLAEFKDEAPRNDTEFSKKYLEGRFGALPFVNFKN